MSRLRRARNVEPGARVIYPPFSDSRYWTVCRVSESGTFTMIERGTGQAYTTFWAPTKVLRERASH